jgi:hypothetical protein
LSSLLAVLRIDAAAALMEINARLGSSTQNLGVLNDAGLTGRATRRITTPL